MKIPNKLDFVTYQLLYPSNSKIFDKACYFEKFKKKRYDRYSLKKNIFLGEIIDIQSFKYFCEKRREEKKLMKINFELIPIKTTKHDEISRYMIKYEIIFYGTVNNDDDTRIRSQINVCTHRYLHMYWSNLSLF